MIGVIQAGGHSSRMGADKAWLTLGASDEDAPGQPLVEYALAAAQAVCDHAALVINSANARAADYRALAARRRAALLFDRHDHRGPLGGLHTALVAYPSETVLILPCDLPFVTAEFLRFLRAVHEREANDLSVPVDAEGRTQMLVGFYAPACLAPVEQMLEADELKIEQLCARVKARRVKFGEYAHLTDAARLLININTPEEYRAARSQPAAFQGPCG